PRRGRTGLDVERLLVFELELLQLAHLGEQARIVERVAEAAKGDDRVDDRREDRAEAVGEGQALVHPGLARGQGLLAIRSEAAGFEALQEIVDAREEPAPVELLARARDVRRLPVLDVELGNRGVIRDRAE